MEAIDRRIVGWTYPPAIEPSSRIPLRENWALSRIDHAFAVVLLYLTFVAFSLLFLKPKKGKAQEKVVKDKKRKKSVGEKFNEAPLLFILMVLYNVAQVLLCGYMVKEAFLGAKERDFEIACNEYSLNPRDRRLLNVLYVFYLSKVLDFADTVFMVLKGSWRQVSFLHVYHHSSIFLVYWLILNAAYDGDVYFTIVLNGFIHFVMYGYYLATTLSISVPIVLKKMITNMQLIQFSCMLIQGAYLLLKQCAYPRNMTWIYLFYITSMFVLFSNFKKKTYKKKKL